MKQNNILIALKNYCGLTPGCGNYQPDIQPQFIQTYTADVSGVLLSCPQGYKVISCGFVSVDTGVAGQYERYWSVWPSNDYSCSAYDYYKGEVFAVCAPADIVGNWESESKPFAAHPVGVADASCPSGYKATGCGLQTNNSGFEAYKEVFPKSDGQSCHCYDYFGGTCWVICSDSILSSRVYETSNTGPLDLTCEGEPSVLGCGINLHDIGTGQFEAYPQFFVNNYNSCHGYSYFLYTYVRIMWIVHK